MTDHSPAAGSVRGVPALLAAIVAAVIVPMSFVFGIGAALDGSGSGAVAFQVVFIAGLVLGIAAIVVSTVHLARGARKTIPLIAIAVALLPLAGVIVVWVANLNAM